MVKISKEKRGGVSFMLRGKKPSSPKWGDSRKSAEKRKDCRELSTVYIANNRESVHLTSSEEKERPYLGPMEQKKKRWVLVKEGEVGTAMETEGRGTPLYTQGSGKKDIIGGKKRRVPKNEKWERKKILLTQHEGGGKSPIINKGKNTSHG